MCQETASIYWPDVLRDVRPAVRYSWPADALAAGLSELRALCQPRPSNIVNTDGKNPVTTTELSSGRSAVFGAGNCESSYHYPDISFE